MTDGVLLLDKPAGITSTRALALAKRALAAPKAGHTGTLDPFATGLLPLAFGEATKFSRFLIDAPKGYEARLRLGEETDTGDPESAPRRVSTEMPKASAIAAVLRGFLGSQRQVPPMHSALHVGGRRLYEYAREGVEVAREARDIRIHALDVVALEGPDLVVSVTCSKGTYVRVLATDIGRALGCGAYLAALRRTSVGPFRLADAVPLAEVQAEGPEKACRRLLPVDALVRGLEHFSADPEEAQRFAHGRVIPGEVAGSEPVAVYAQGGRFLGVAEPAPGGGLAPLRLMALRDEIP